MQSDINPGVQAAGGAIGLAVSIGAVAVLGIAGVEHGLQSGRLAGASYAVVSMGLIGTQLLARHVGWGWMAAPFALCCALSGSATACTLTPKAAGGCGAGEWLRWAADEPALVSLALVALAACLSPSVSALHRLAASAPVQQEARKPLRRTARREHEGRPPVELVRIEPSIADKMQRFIDQRLVRDGGETQASVIIDAFQAWWRAAYGDADMPNREMLANALLDAGIDKRHARTGKLYAASLSEKPLIKAL